MKASKTVMIMGLLLFLGMTASVYAQDKYGSEPDKCKTNLSLFHEAVKMGNYEAAYEPWKWCLDNCPEASKIIYSDGIKMTEAVYDKSAGELTVEKGKKIATNDHIVKIDKQYFDLYKADKSVLADKAKDVILVYEMREKHFPDNLGKVYSDWANFLFKRGVVEGIENGDAIYEKLGQSFKADPTGMSVKNLGKYFQTYTDLNKDTNPQAVFDTYDDIMDAISKKMDGYSKDLDALSAKEAKGQSLTSKEKSKKRAREVNLTALGQVEGYLDNTLSEVATCERLVPLYKDNFEANKGNVSWLKRAVSRLNQKECTDNPLYPQMVEAYVNAAPSSDAYVFYAGILMESGDTNKAVEYFNKAIDLESDNYKKAKYYYRLALIMKKQGSLSKAREYAYLALKERPSMGSAYLLIANLYASSANSCGTDEISKRMVYVAAADKARQAKAVDPSITSTANKYISSYMASAPSKKLVFTEGLTSGSTHKIGCWINESARIP
jgi:tetratricopeptide (TPR) repeat protein